ncbi:MAG: hypothetical protein PHQ53_00920 [Candidatus Krumholzibacteria bacterium]|nr:hypothetical protein [Candidatus Krumholzibacteria bacterium]
MLRPVLFIDLAGTLVLQRPDTGRWGMWPGVDALLAGLTQRFELHLATGEARAGAAAELGDLKLCRYFSAVHADLPGGGKPFGVLAAMAGRPPQACLAIGDDPFNDTAGDSDQVVSLLLRHGAGLIDPHRVETVIRALADRGAFLPGFEKLLAESRSSAVTAAAAAATAAARTAPSRPGTSNASTTRSAPAAPVLQPLALAGGGHIGWWQKSSGQRRPIVLLDG